MIRYTRKLLIVAVVTGVVGLSTSLQAAVTVDNISLKKLDSFTEVTIYTSDRVEFSHEIVDPGAGKPYRVVLDIREAVHKLPRFNFTELPSRTITSIRTSQFSVKPERTVRVVLDVSGRVTYKTRSTDNSVTIALITPDDPEFPFWCAQPMSESEKLQLALSLPSDQNNTGSVESEEPEPVLVSSVVSEKPDNGPKLPSWVERQVQKSAAEPDQSAAIVEQAQPVKEYEEPRLAMDVFRPEFDMAQIEEEPTKTEPQIHRASSTIAEEKPEAESYTASDMAINPPVAVTSVPERQTPHSEPVVMAQADVVPAPPSAKKQAVPTPKVPATENKLLQPAGLTDSALNRETGAQDGDGKDGTDEQTPAETPKPNLPSKEPEGDDFRKNPDAPTKTSGTLADRFPKRKIITYQSWGKPDPFAALIDSRGRSGSGPDEIPDVESLRLVGVLKANDEASALLEDLEGYGYILKDGDSVKNGYVVQIGRDKIIFHLSEYGWSRTVALRMETDD